eukprot:5672084-Pleurochrysis_carterae.AAC.1
MATRHARLKFSALNCAPMTLRLCFFIALSASAGRLLTYSMRPAMSSRLVATKPAFSSTSACAPTAKATGTRP